MYVLLCIICKLLFVSVCTICISYLYIYLATVHVYLNYHPAPEAACQVISQTNISQHFIPISENICSCTGYWSSQSPFAADVFGSWRLRANIQTIERRKQKRLYSNSRWQFPLGLSRGEWVRDWPNVLKLIRWPWCDDWMWWCTNMAART